LQYITEKDKQILIGTSFGFVAVPGVYGIIAGSPYIGILSIMAGVISIIHWSSCPMCENKHILDLLFSRLLAVVYVLWIAYYCYNLPHGYSLICLFIAFFTLVFYSSSVYFGSREGNPFWIMCHYGFHYCCLITQLYLYYLSGTIV